MDKLEVFNGDVQAVSLIGPPLDAEGRRYTERAWYAFPNVYNSRGELSDCFCGIKRQRGRFFLYFHHLTGVQVDYQGVGWFPMKDDGPPMLDGEFK